MNLLGRELQELCSRPAWLGIRVVFLGVLLIGSLLVWHTAEGAESLALRPVFGRNLYSFFSAAAYALALIAVPAFVMTSVSAERESGTLDLLLVSPLSDLSIVLQKVAARLTLLCVLLCAALPFTLISTFLGGVSTYDIALALLRCFAAAAFVSLYALTVSLRGHDLKWTWVSAALCIVITPIAYVEFWRSSRKTWFVLIVVLLLVGITLPRQWGGEFLVSALFPLHAMAAGFEDPAANVSRDCTALAVCAIGAWSFARLAARNLRIAPGRPTQGVRRSERFRYSAAARSRRRSLLQRLVGGSAHQGLRVAAETVSLKRRSLSPFRQWLSRRVENPFLDRALCAPTTSVDIFGAVLAVVACSLTLATPRQDVFFDFSALYFGFTQLSVLSVGLAAVLRGSTAIARAGRTGLLEALLVSPMRSTAIFAGFTLETLWFLRWFWAPALPVGLWTAVMRQDWFFLFAPVLVSGGTILGLHALATLLTLRFAHERTAQAVGLGLLFVPLLIAPMLDPLLPEPLANSLRFSNPLWVLTHASASLACACGLLWTVVGVMLLLLCGPLFDRVRRC